MAHKHCTRPGALMQYFQRACAEKHILCCPRSIAHLQQQALLKLHVCIASTSHILIDFVESLQRIAGSKIKHQLLHTAGWLIQQLCNIRNGHRVCIKRQAGVALAPVAHFQLRAKELHQMPLALQGIVILHARIPNGSLLI